MDLSLARQAGITFADHALHPVASQQVLISRRFDRDGERRFPLSLGSHYRWRNILASNLAMRLKMIKQVAGVTQGWSMTVERTGARRRNHAYGERIRAWRSNQGAGAN